MQVSDLLRHLSVTSDVSNELAENLVDLNAGV